MKKILLIESQESLPPRRQLFLNTLNRNGYEVKVIFWDRSGTNPEREEKDGISYEWIKVEANYVDAKAFMKLPRIYFMFFKKIINERFDVIVCGHSALLPLAVIAGKTKKTKIVFDVVEFYIQDFFIRRPVFIRWISPIIRFFENLLVKLVDGVIIIPSYREIYSGRFRRYNSNITIIKNVPVLGGDAPEVEECNEELNRKYEDNKVIIYAGSISYEWGITKLLESVLIIKETFPEVKLVILGKPERNFGQVIRDYIRDNNLDYNVDIVGRVPYSMLSHYFRLALIGAAPTQPVGKYKVFTKGTSRKIFEYMGAGLPVLAPDFGEIALAVKEENCGVLVDSSDPRQMAAASVSLLKNPDKAREMGERGRKAVERKYNWQIESLKLLKFYNEL